VVPTEEEVARRVEDPSVAPEADTGHEVACAARLLRAGMAMDGVCAHPKECR
jgi:hypothetical protein